MESITVILGILGIMLQFGTYTIALIALIVSIIKKAQKK